MPRRLALFNSIDLVFRPGQEGGAATRNEHISVKKYLKVTVPGTS